MKRFRGIIQDIKAPSTSDLWINNGESKYYTSNGWKAIAGNGSSMYMFYRVTFKQQKDGIQQT
jgi:hypothetical protein